MDNINNTNVINPVTKDSNYGNWSIFIILFIFLAIFIIWIIYKYFFSTFKKEISNKEKENVTTPTPTPSSAPSELYKNTSNIDENNIIIKDENLNNALENSPQSNTTPIADDSYSNIQLSKPTTKSGWCYIGEERGFRSCIEVGDNDLCMSGNIFPSQEICINPSLR
jgi:hypothetical protein